MIDWPNQTVSAALNLGVGFIAGVGSGLVVSKLQERKESIPGVNPKDTGQRFPQAFPKAPPDWSGILVTSPPRVKVTSEPGGQQGEGVDPWVEIILEVAAMVIMGTVYVLLADWIAAFLVAFVVGLVTTVAVVTLKKSNRGSLPPGGPAILVRALLVGALSLVAIALTYLASYRGITLERVHHVVIGVSGFSAKVQSISTNFHSDGWSLVIGLLLGLCAVTALLVRVTGDVLSTLALQRMANGSNSKLTTLIARWYPGPCDWNGWGIIVVFMAVSIALCSGLAVNLLHPGHPQSTAAALLKLADLGVGRM